MEFNNYQNQARKTAIYPKNMEILYPILGLAGETGEVCEKIKKVYRDNNGYFSKEEKQKIGKELGDVLWYISNIASDLDIELEEIAKNNLEKLFSRKEKDKLHGSGDDR